MGNRSAVGEDDELIAGLLNFSELMGRDEYGGAGLRETTHQLADLDDACWVEAVSWFVEDHEFGLSNERYRDAESLAHAERVAARSVVGAVGEVVSVLGHQHEIGAWFRMTVNPGKPDERVLLDIPKWDFDWQYNYIPAQPIVIDADDLIRIECGWNRAFRDPRLEPAYVLWADGTDDEMCFATITTRPPAS